jgi:mannose-6-phosphate isomerase-like protein (cupin superfamily)
MELKKIFEDKRGYIYLVNELFDGGKEFTFLEIKDGFARGGCLHSKDEHLVVLKGCITFICGDNEETLVKGDSRVIPAEKPHAFIALKDSIVSEWGITSEDKKMDGKDLVLRSKVDRINEENS